jgi:tripartite-type tricarboxylate transporter receptor subunit TctC
VHDLPQRSLRGHSPRIGRQKVPAQVQALLEKKLKYLKSMLVRFGLLALGGTFAGTVVAQESAAAFPSRPIKLVVPYAAGGFPDTVSRMVGQRAGEVLGQPIIIENRPGAGGLAACEMVARATPDGYTLLAMDNAHWGINPALYPKLPYDTVRDFSPVSMMGVTPMFLFVHSSVPATNLQELIALAKAKPNQMNYGSSGIGSIHHLAMEMVKSVTGIEVVHIPFKGTGQSVPALMGGQTSLMVASLPSLAAHVKGGTVRILAVIANKRVTQAPTVPTFPEQGVPALDFLTHVGMLAPAGTPAAVIAKLNAGIARALENPDLVQKLAGVGVEPAAGSPENFASQIQAEMKKYATAVRVSGAKVNN